MKDFKNMTFEIVDLTVNAMPDMFVNRSGITFTKKVLEDLNYPANVQYCINAESKVFAVRACKSNETKPTPFSKPRAEQTQTCSTSNKNLVESVKLLMPKDYDSSKRYKVAGHFEPETRTMYFDMDEAVIDMFRQPKSEEE